MSDVYRAEFLDLAMECGATVTGTPDGREPITIVFSVEAWRAFDRACGLMTINAPSGTEPQKLISSSPEASK